MLELNYLQNDADFGPLLQQVRSATPEILFIPGHDESGIILKQAQDMGLKVAFLGGDGWGGPGFYLDGGRELKEGYFSSHWSPEINTPKSRNFIKRYRSYPVDAGMALAYDAVFLLANAVSRAASWDKEKIRSALAQTRGFQGVTGTITFTGNGDPIKSVVINKIINGKEHYLKTYAPPNP